MPTIVLVQRPGADALGEVRQLAAARRVTRRLEAVALGPGMGAAATDALLTGRCRPVPSLCSRSERAREDGFGTKVMGTPEKFLRVVDFLGII